MGGNEHENTPPYQHVLGALIRREQCSDLLPFWRCDRRFLGLVHLVQDCVGVAVIVSDGCTNGDGLPRT